MLLLPIKFEYLETDYDALLRVKVKEAKTEYYITVMNGDLEKILYGNHVITEENGVLQLGIVPDSEAGRLKCKIAESIKKLINH
jgi:hypothetical protein